MQCGALIVTVEVSFIYMHTLKALAVLIAHDIGRIKIAKKVNRVLQT